MCGAEFERVINEMIKDGSCPYCENKKVLVGYNDLKTTRPDIAKEWGIENYLLVIGGLEGYKYNSTKRVYWKCPKCNTRYKMCQLMIGSSKKREGMNRAGSALAE